MLSLDPGLARLLQAIQESSYPPIAESTPAVAVARKALRAMTADVLPMQLRQQVGSVEDMTVGERPGRVYRPEGSGEIPTLVYFHGGGFVLGDLDTHDQFCRRICSGAGAVVVSVDYRLAPEHPFPAAVDDAHAALLWASDHRLELGGGSVVAVAGDSAGGNLAAVVAQTEPHLVSAQVLIYPATDAFGSYASREECGRGYFLETDTLLWFMHHYLSGDPVPTEDDVRHSPLLAPADALKVVPPAMIATAEFDPLRDEGKAYADALGAAGIPVDYQVHAGMIHGFVDMGHFSPGAQAASDNLILGIGSLLRRVE